ncbi:GTP cyclohydrolase [Nannizzia gypsea CBS 118893]|uniref:GTP cyclohydrolase n=1 Tax=Arthroderma gypseum (strain ATCC MYA-4604 / CBS 118893) TaxID=535722 RepID=E4UV26_ARTGP|nr:GTP cyclohydrolase [Nannizzia gypsea CBS 118893]EFR01143.1 GTP cyclohydrolase [Nannizzia gypsea CBS 118893]
MASKGGKTEPTGPKEIPAEQRSSDASKDPQPKTAEEKENPILAQVLAAVKRLELDQGRLSLLLDSMNGRIENISFNKDIVKMMTEDQALDREFPPGSMPTSAVGEEGRLKSAAEDATGVPRSPTAVKSPKRGGTSRIILTTYPGQSGIDPIKMDWGNMDPKARGPVVVSRQYDTVRRRNAIGAHGGSYSIYHALAVASNNLDTEHRPDFTNTEPATKIGPFPQWGDKKKIVAMDPWGHLAPWLFEELRTDHQLDIRPTIAITRAHMKLPELADSVRSGRLVPDGKICLNETGELAVTKVAVEPVWYLPGVAERFGIDEGTLRRALFEVTGGSFPELITRGDIKVFLPPIGGLTAYIFGDPAKMSDLNAKLALRVHDECNGSDVFGSDICTCRPYLIFGVEEAVKEAQKGGSGVVIYFRKEGRALGEVTKYLVYNARASEYFKRTENIAGVKDMRFQALMPDILHWLGITKIDRMLSMSNMKHDAIVEQGIPIIERVPIPDELIPEDSRVEIDAKIHAGYFTSGKVMNLEELSNVQGRQWDDVDVSYPVILFGYRGSNTGLIALIEQPGTFDGQIHYLK